MCGLGVVLDEEVGIVGWVTIFVSAKEVFFKFPWVCESKWPFQ